MQVCSHGNHDLGLSYKEVESPSSCDGKPGRDFCKGLVCSGIGCKKVFVDKLTGKDQSEQFKPSVGKPAYKCACNFFVCQWAYCNTCFCSMQDGQGEGNAGTGGARASKRKRGLDSIPADRDGVQCGSGLAVVGASQLPE